MRVLIALVFLVASGCEENAETAITDQPVSEPQLPKSEVHVLVGTWEGQDGSFTFLEDGTMNLPLSDIPAGSLSWDTVDIEYPHQLYATINVDGELTRTMMGIYKVVDGKFYFRQPIEYFQTIGGIPIGSPTRVEYPKDFSANVSVYERVEPSD